MRLYKENLTVGVITEAEYEARIASHQGRSGPEAVVTPTRRRCDDGDSSVDATTGDVELLIPSDGGE